jgi:hypothetical protein
VPKNWLVLDVKISKKGGAGATFDPHYFLGSMIAHAFLSRDESLDLYCNCVAAREFRSNLELN